jgi:citronellyl-CoA dehydrogenase
VFGKPLISKQVLRHRIADWLTEIECMKQLTYHIVRMKMEGLDVTREVSMGKLFAAQLAQKVVGPESSGRLPANVRRPRLHE